MCNCKIEYDKKGYPLCDVYLEFRKLTKKTVSIAGQWEKSLYIQM